MMAINFPIKPEIRLQNPPLSEVVCQVRFPALLRILNEMPVDFQDHIRSRFPELGIEHNISVRLPKSDSIEKPATEGGEKIYRFSTDDKTSAASLAVNFFALSTNRYQHWDVFINDLDFVYSAVQNVYQPAYATRIGLRFINQFTMENSQVDSVYQLLNLFHPDLTVLLNSEVWHIPNEALSQIFLTDENAKLMLRSGYGIEKERPFFLLDLDYFEEGKIQLYGLRERVEQYHQMIYNAFRWCILDDSLANFGIVKQEAG
ncbi:MAG: TIGR04255 family protein [Anaerolineales bacterium]|nr:TIGR04255 family protein [Anaerolineales bacterium]